MKLWATVLAAVVGIGVVVWLFGRGGPRTDIDITVVQEQLVKLREWSGARQTHRSYGFAQRRAGLFGWSNAELFVEWNTEYRWGFQFPADWEFRPRYESAGSVLHLSVPPVTLLDASTRDWHANDIDSGTLINEVEMLDDFEFVMAKAAWGDGVRLLQSNPDIQGYVVASLSDFALSLYRGVPGITISEVQLEVVGSIGLPSEAVGILQELLFKPPAVWKDRVEMFDRLTQTYEAEDDRLDRPRIERDFEAAKALIGTP